MGKREEVITFAVAVAEAEKKMIYRKWSLLTGPVTILGSIVGAVVVANQLFVDNDQFVKLENSNANTQPQTK